MKVLFIGNSFTYFNDMPYTFSNMLRQSEPDSRVEAIAYGGYSLMQYADETTEGKVFCAFVSLVVTLHMQRELAPLMEKKNLTN